MWPAHRKNNKKSSESNDHSPRAACGRRPRREFFLDLLSVRWPHPARAAAAQPLNLCERRELCCWEATWSWKHQTRSSVAKRCEARSGSQNENEKKWISKQNGSQNEKNGSQNNELSLQRSFAISQDSRLAPRACYYEAFDAQLRPGIYPTLFAQDTPRFLAQLGAGRSPRAPTVLSLKES